MTTCGRRASSLACCCMLLPFLSERLPLRPEPSFRLSIIYYRPRDIIIPMLWCITTQNFKVWTIYCAPNAARSKCWWYIPGDRNEIGWDSLIRDSKRYFSIITSEGIKLLHSKISAEAYFTSLPTEMTLTFDTRIAQPHRLKVFMSPIQSCNWCGNHLE